MKKLLSTLLLAAVLATALSGLSLTVSAESMYIKKIVSVVYDDSGSMKGDKWAYANYAMQAFCGMLNSDDQLFITYMSSAKKDPENYEPDKQNLSSEKIQDSIDSIRSHTESDSTPYKAVEIAYEKLASVKDSNPNTQYWLVVITDGYFDEMDGLGEDARQRFLNEGYNDHEGLASYAEKVMPNGSHPKITFLGIGQVAAPTHNTDKGIYVYPENVTKDLSASPEAIIEEMSKMADRISGRTRLESGITSVDDKTIRVESKIPLLNIVVFSQGSEAKVTGARHNNENDIPVTREAELSYPGYSDLVGGAYLLGDSQRVIGSGAYEITFDREVSVDDLTILFEPAIEMRMTLSVNGREITDYKELDDVAAGDRIAASCKLYEMGTENEIDPALMPPGTQFDISVSENGQVKQQSEGTAPFEYVLNDVETSITSTLLIDGFKPITRTETFTPLPIPVETEPPVVYTIEPSFGSGVQSVKLTEIEQNEELTVVFTVYADAVALTDAAAVKALSPKVTTAPEDGNTGVVSYTEDGKIVFTPKTAKSGQDDAAGGFGVTVTCAIADGTATSATYTVLLSDYQVLGEDGGEPVRKNEFYGNPVGVSFRVLKDGVQLDRAEVEREIANLPDGENVQLEARLNEAYGDLSVSVSIAEDGVITVTPAAAEERTLTFWRWWGNWAYYFGLPGEDVEVTLSHPLGTAAAAIDVTEAGAKYLILNVALPLLLEILILAAIIAYIIRYITKPRFPTNGALYVGSIDRSRGNDNTHRMELSEVRLGKYNTFKNLWNPFKELTISANGISITAAKGNKLLCNEAFPWYTGMVRPKQRTIHITCPKDIVDYCQDHTELVIREILPSSVMDEQNRLVSQDDSVYYFVRADVTYVQAGAGQKEVIESAVAFCYTIAR